MNKLNGTIEYLMSVNILKDLRNRNLITEKEFEAINIENKNAFTDLSNEPNCLELVAE